MIILEEPLLHEDFSCMIYWSSHSCMITLEETLLHEDYREAFLHDIREEPFLHATPAIPP